MKSWLSQITIGVIVTVIGTVIANAIVKGPGGKHGYWGGGGYYSGGRSGR